MLLSEELRTMIRGRAARAFGGEKVHRITEVTEKSLLYRISGRLVGRALHGGPKIKIRQDKIGRIYVPREC